MDLQFQCIYRLLSNKIRALVKKVQTLRGMVPEEERCLMSLPNWVTEIPAVLLPALGCCSLVPVQTDGSHHYQASTPPWVAVETGISRGDKKKEQSPDQHRAQLSTYAIQMHQPELRDRPELDQVHLYLFSAHRRGSAE